MSKQEKMEAAAIEFCRRVEAGEIRSKRSYAAFKSALSEDRMVAEPAGWFNPWNEFHGYQQVSAEFAGKPGTIPLYLAPPDSAPSGEAVRACSHPGDKRMGTGSVSSDGSGHMEWTCSVCGHHERTEWPAKALTAPGASVTYESAIEPNYVVETYKSIDRNLGASVGQNSSDVVACRNSSEASRQLNAEPEPTTSDPTPQDAKPKIVCHAEGDRCLGCDHWKGKSPVCKYAPQDAKADAGEIARKFCDSSCSGFGTPRQGICEDCKSAAEITLGVARTLPPSASKPDAEYEYWADGDNYRVMRAPKRQAAWIGSHEVVALCATGDDAHERAVLIANALNAYATPSASKPATVEEIARIIDPDGWVEPKHPAPDDNIFRSGRRISATIKSHAILALINARTSGVE